VAVILISGPQATGKTTLAIALGAELGVPVFSRDPLIAALLSGYPRWLRRLHRRSVATAGIRLQTALLARQLELGQSAIIECIVPPAARERWRQMATAAGCRFTSVECVCSDATVHRERFLARDRARRPGAARRQGAGWRGVAVTMRRYQRDPEADFVADAVRPTADLVADISVIAAPGGRGEDS
jgi:predicted kinase